MKATDMLVEEHHVINQVLDALEQMAGRIDAGQAPQLEMGRDAVDFIRHFADRIHHAKEENVLFKMMETRGFSPDAGPVAVMLAEHDEGRGHVGRMAAALDEVGQDAGAWRRFAGHARSYVDLLRAHIEKENQILYPMADQALTAEDQRALDAAFADLEREHAADRTRLLAIASALADRYGVDRAGR